MPVPGMHATAAACIALLACTAISACRDGGGEQPKGVRAGDSAASTPPDTDVSDPSIAASRVRIGLTGLILMMPPPNAAGATQLFMPRAGGHVAYVAFHGANSPDCNAYNPAFGICFVSLEGVRIEPFGRPGNSAGRPAIPQGVANVFHGSTIRADTNGINGRIRARASLLSGRAVNPCHLAEWSFAPLGPARQELTSVLTWEIPDHPDNTPKLVLAPVNGTLPPRREFTLTRRPGGPVELLILHLPTYEFELLRRATRGPGTNLPPVFNSGTVETEASAHFEATYTMINAPTTARPKPTQPLPNGNVCPIDVLELKDAVYPTSRLRDRERLQLDPQLVPTVNAGIRTYSCVMTSADGS
jgi:hypothetical protein